MRIALVIDRIEPFYRGGYERRAWELAKRLAVRHDVTVFTSAPSNQSLEGVHVRAVCRNRSYFKKDGFRDLKANALFSLALIPYLLSNRRYDVVDCNATPFLHIFPAALLARRWKAEFVITAHEALGGTMNGYFKARRGLVPSLKGRAARSIYYATQRLGRHLIASSSVTAEELRREGFGEVFTCAGGVTMGLRPKLAYSGRVVFVGRLVPNKKVAVLIDAFAAARARSAVDKLTIIGDGPDRRQLELQARQLSITPHVLFAGDVGEERKFEILAGSADVFVSASLREGFSLAALEALAAGNPAIISHVPSKSQQGATEYVRDGFNGLITDGSVEAIAQALTRLSNDQNLYRRLSQNAVQTAGAYTWDSVANRLGAIYERITTEPSPRRPEAAVPDGQGHELRTTVP